MECTRNNSRKIAMFMMFPLTVLAQAITPFGSSDINYVEVPVPSTASASCSFPIELPYLPTPSNGMPVVYATPIWNLPSAGSTCTTSGTSYLPVLPHGFLGTYLDHFVWYRQFANNVWYDGTGLPVASPTPYASLRTKQAKNMVGFEFIGKFAGQVDSSTLLPVQSVYFHETEIYASGIEFGFIHQPNGPSGNPSERKFTVYWGKFENRGATQFVSNCLSGRHPTGSGLEKQGSDNVIGDQNGAFSLSAIFTPTNPASDAAYRYRIYVINNSTLRFRVYPYNPSSPCTPDATGCSPIIDRDIQTALDLSRIYNNGYGLPGFVTATQLGSTNAPSSTYPPILTVYGLSKITQSTTSSAAPTIDSFSPRVIDVSSTGTVMAPVMQVVARDADGYNNLNVVNILINKYVDGMNACFLAHSVQDKAGYLVPDSGSGLIGPAYFTGFDFGQGSGCQSLPTQSGEAGSCTGTNSRCILHIRSTSTEFANYGNGDGGLSPVSTYNHNGDLFLSSIQLSAKVATSTSGPGIIGNKVIWAGASDLQSNGSGWTPVGVLRVPPLTYPRVQSLSPAEAASSTFSFTASLSDASDYLNIKTVWVLINNQLSGNTACYIVYTRASNELSLLNDVGNALITPARYPGGGFTPVSNNQCTVSAATVSGSGQTLSLSLTVQGTSAFIGNRIVYVGAETNSGGLTDWQPMGYWLAL